MSKRQLTATTLRVILSVSLVVIAAGGIALFTLADGRLQQVATDVSHVVVDASASQNNLTTLEQVKKTLETDQAVVNRASDIVADSQSYQYQDQILTDLNGYAAQAGIGITNIDFSASQSTTKAPAVVMPTAPIGVKTVTVFVTLQNPVNYNSLLRLMGSIEQNLTKMQISKISLSRSKDSNDITSDVLAIEVYVR